MSESATQVQNQLFMLRIAMVSLGWQTLDLSQLSRLMKMAKQSGDSRFFLADGLGAASFIGHPLEDFTPEHRLLATCMATVRLFDRHGNRENMARNRMRYLVHELGWEKFQKMVLKERSIVEMTTSYSTAQLLDVKSHEDTGDCRQRCQG